ncbi:membrane protein [Arenicella chitinivorans]|uniref:Membrane protein n=1 Tax=Arenicella chitinivorans TaxID=1329800 RepID=A0A918VI85_9GAMM|nr:OmpA family protein [Arenicella chitinivorans]GGZ98311.1 membrane protein [Arenicella chitinivorans]
MLIFLKRVLTQALVVTSFTISTVGWAASDILVGIYPGLSEYSTLEESFFAYPVAVTPIDDDGVLTPKIIKGKLAHSVFVGSDQDNTLEVYQSFYDALSNGGFELVFTCSNSECGGDLVYELVGKSSIASAYAEVRQSGPVNTDFHYLVARQKQADNPAWLSYFIYKYRGNKLYLAQDVVTPKAIATKQVDIKIAFDEIDQSGRVILDGLYFATDSDALQPTSSPALKDISAYLKRHPKRQFFVVGHTDSQGSFSHNQSLSERRANAVVSALVTDYGVPSTMLAARGVGPLSPKASNLSEAGRSHNRRVELVPAN